MANETNEIRTFLALQILERRKKAKLSQAALSKATKLSIARISEIERAVANPTLDTLEALAKVLRVPLVDLLDYDGSLQNTDRIKGEIAASLDRFDATQLRTIFSLIRVMRQ